MTKIKNALPEIWGGIECTINRVDDCYMDQIGLAGLYNNPAYLDTIINLGLKQIRFPVLLEKHQPALSTQIDWSFTEDCWHKTYNSYYPRISCGMETRNGTILSS